MARAPKLGALNISIHALREESDPIPFRLRLVARFQSTLSVRRATDIKDTHSAQRTEFQSTLSVRRATRWYTLRDGKRVQFQSTLSVRRATVQLDIFVRFLRRKPAA